jgi:hypothetical protein
VSQKNKVKFNRKSNSVVHSRKFQKCFAKPSTSTEDGFAILNLLFTSVTAGKLIYEQHQK